MNLFTIQFLEPTQQILVAETSIPVTEVQPESTQQQTSMFSEMFSLNKNTSSHYFRCTL